jgi:hypothetical protein
MTITYPSALPIGAQYWKYGPEPGNATPHWYVLPATIGATTVVFSITDGSRGDDDLTINGIFVDQGGPGAPPVGTGAIQTPTMSEWMMMVMALLMLLGACLEALARDRLRARHSAREVAEVRVGRVAE